jgi:hypothetical protein
MKVLFTFILLSGVCFAQNKKEQIEILNFRVDSLNKILAKERNSFNDKNNALNKTIQLQKSEIELVKKELVTKQTELDKQITETARVSKLLIKAQTEIEQMGEKLTFHIPPPTGPGTGVCEITLSIDKSFLLATETCGGHDEYGRTESTEKLFNIEFKRDFRYKVSELFDTDMGRGYAFGCEFFEIKENKLYLYDENNKIINDWFCTVGGFAVNYEENTETCDCIFFPSEN